MNYSTSYRHKSQTQNHTRDRNNKRNAWLSLILFRFSLRDYGFCMTSLFLFCLGSLFYQWNGGPPKFLLEFRQYLGKIRSLIHLYLFPCGFFSPIYSVQQSSCPLAFLFLRRTFLLLSGASPRRVTARFLT